MSGKSSSFTLNVLKLITGSIAAQGLGILVAPIITRLFAPEEFGVAAVFASIIGIGSVLACLRYQMAIMLPKSREEAANIVGVSILSVSIVTAISALAVLFAAERIVSLLKVRELMYYLWLVPVAIFVNGIFVALSCWTSRSKRFGRLSIAGILSSLTTNITKLVLGFAGLVSAGVLIVSGILGSIISTLVLGRLVWRDDQGLFKSAVRWAKMMSGFRRYKKFPLVSTWSALLNVSSQYLPVLLLSFYFSPAVVGFFSLGRNVLSIPMNFIGGAIARVFYQKAAEANNRPGELANVVEQVFKRLVSIGVLPILILTIVGKDLFVIVFGARWAEAGVYVQIMGVWMFFNFISSPMSTLTSVLEKQGAGLCYNGVLFVLRGVSLVVGASIGNARTALIIYSATGTLFYIWFLFWLLTSAKVPLLRVLSHSKYFIYPIPLLGITSFAKWGLSLGPPPVLIIAFLTMIPYYFMIFGHDQILKKHIRMAVPKFRSY